MVASFFPLELVFEVLSHLEPRNIQDANTLRAASLTSSLFRTFCQRILFRRLVIGASPGDLLIISQADPTIPTDPTTQRLAEILTHSPFLSGYVRDLVVRDDSRWVCYDKKLPEVLNILLRQPLQSFTCTLCGFWAEHPLATRTAILDICALPSLRDLHLSEVPLGLVLLQSPLLNNLWIESASDDETGGDEHHPNALAVRRRGITTTTRVEDLLLSDQASLNWLIRPGNGLDMTTLTSMSIKTPLFRIESPNLTPLFSLCASSLAELHVGSGFFRDGHLTEITGLVHLKVFTINIDHDTNELRHSGDLFFSLQRILQTLPSTNALELMQLGTWESVSFGPGINTSALKLLDEILSDRRRFPHLKRMVLGFSTYLKDLTQNDIRALGVYLPKLRQAQMLCVTSPNASILLPSVAERVVNKY